MGWLFSVNLFANVFCAAVNCYTWRLGYPLWREAGPQFGRVHRTYMARLTPVITMPHVVLFFASLTYALWRPAAFSPWLAWLVLALDTAVIAVSALIAGPIHTRFTQAGFDEAALRVLLRVSAFRSGALLLACALLLFTAATLRP